MIVKMILLGLIGIGLAQQIDDINDEEIIKFIAGLTSEERKTVVDTLKKFEAGLAYLDAKKTIQQITNKAQESVPKRTMPHVKNSMPGGMKASEDTMERKKVNIGKNAVDDIFVSLLKFKEALWKGKLLLAKSLITFPLESWNISRKKEE